MRNGMRAVILNIDLSCCCDPCGSGLESECPGPRFSCPTAMIYGSVVKSALDNAEAPEFERAGDAPCASFYEASARDTLGVAPFSPVHSGRRAFKHRTGSTAPQPRRRNVALALARIRSDAILSQALLKRSLGAMLGRSLAGRMKVPRARLYLGAALAVVLIGIGVNALVLQRERHPAPLFGPPPSPSSSPAPGPAAPLPPQAASADRDSSAPETSPATSLATQPATPPARPTDTVEATPSRASDPITDLLRGEARGDATRLVAAAQTQLVKLGYPVKPDGNEDAATQQALRDFERAHGLPLSTEITRRLVKQLTQAARAGGH